LAVGKLADLALLDANPLTIDPDRLAGIKVQAAYKEGEEVWRR
jgi:predicted amidohydrolase YtcJ